MPNASASDEMRQLRTAFQVLAGGDCHRLRLVRDDHRMRGRVLERYAAVPNIGNPRVLLPLDAAPLAQRAMLQPYVAGTVGLGGRSAARLLRLASRMYLMQPMLRHRLAIITTADNLAETPLHAFLSTILGRSDFVTSLRLAPGRPNSKPVVQAVAHDGSVLGYAKFGWEKLTCRLMRHEAVVLRDLRLLTQGSALRVPEVIHAGEWQGLETVVLAPLDCKGRTPRAFADLPVAASVVLAGLRPKVVERLGDSAFWRRTQARINQLAPFMSDQVRQLILEVEDCVETRWGSLKVPIGYSHGDWIPPNMLARHDGICNVWDWERAATDAPLGIDAAQFVIFLVLLTRHSAHSWAARISRFGRMALSRLGLDPAHLAPLVTLSLLQTLLWFAEANEAGRGSEDDRRYCSALAAMLECA